MLLRVRTPNGQLRIEVNEMDTLASLKQKIAEKEPSFPLFEISEETTKKVLTNDKASLKSLNLKHGDLLLLKSTSKEEDHEMPKEPEVEEEDKEDPVDIELSKKDGWIERQRDQQICRHGANGRCTHCMPIPPWDFINHEPWKQEGIRFIPFHAYLRKVIVDSGCRHTEEQKCFYCKPLSIPSYQVKPCSKHPPWPEGICTECKPKACRIDSQSYRHVDRVIFDNPEVLNQFLQSWRETGNQRCGYLYGKYIPDDHIPLGVQALVSAIYEPPQKNSREEAVLEKDPDAERVEVVAQMLGLQKVGFIWTDIQIDNSRRVIRNRIEYPLTSKEIITMAKMQNKAPSVCKKASDKKMGSKFVSILITGNEKGEVVPSSFQVSDQCMQLVKDKIITFTSDPALLRMKKTSKRYIPDVMYQKKNEYGLEIIQKAEPTFPTEFFIVRLAEGAQKKPSYLFKSPNPFTIENRGRNQTFPKLQLDTSLKTHLSDFHLILYLSSKVESPVLQKVIEYLHTGNGLEEVKKIIQPLIPQPEPARNRTTSQSRTIAPSQPPSQPSPSQPSRVSQPPERNRTSSQSGGSAPAPAPASQQSRTKYTPQQEKCISQIADMGFDRQQAIRALDATNWNVQQATDLLLASL